MTSPKRRRVKMTAVQPDPVSMAIMTPTFVGAVMKSDGSTDYVCAGCDTVLLEAMERDKVKDVAVTCKQCGTTSVPIYSG